jgi:hypothetical protein
MSSAKLIPTKLPASIGPLHGIVGVFLMSLQLQTVCLTQPTFPNLEMQHDDKESLNLVRKRRWQKGFARSTKNEFSQQAIAHDIISTIPSSLLMSHGMMLSPQHRHLSLQAISCNAISTM